MTKTHRFLLGLCVAITSSCGGRADSTGGVVSTTSQQSGGSATGGSSLPKGGSGVVTSGGSSSTAGSMGGASGASSHPCDGPFDDFVDCPMLTCTLCSNVKGPGRTAPWAESFAGFNVLFALDKSASMGSVPVGYTRTKWVDARASLKAVFGSVEPSANYGLLLFPSANAAHCELGDGAAAVDVTVGPVADNGLQILERLFNTTPGGATPTAAALRAALRYYTSVEGLALVGSKYVVLVTDGGPNCNQDLVCAPETCTANLERDPPSCGQLAPNCCEVASAEPGRPSPQSFCLDEFGVLAAIDALLAEGIRTFVVGLPGSETYASSLEQFAIHGGVPTLVGGKPSYYKVTGEADLTEHLTSITTSLMRNCTIPLAHAPLDLLQLNVAIDCNPIPQQTGDVQNWHYDAEQMAIVFDQGGPVCESLLTEGAGRLDVIFGCPTWPIR